MEGNFDGRRNTCTKRFTGSQTKSLTVWSALRVSSGMQVDEVFVSPWKGILLFEISKDVHSATFYGIKNALRRDIRGKHVHNYGFPETTLLG